MIKSRFLLWGVGLCLLPAHAFAANSYAIAAGATTTIDEHGVCRKVTNNAAQTIFVPTKTATEWSAFVANAGITTRALCDAIITFTASAQNATNLATYTFSSLNLGTAYTDRKIIIGIGARAGTSQTPTSVTVGGVTATHVASVVQNGSYAGIYIASVPTGTTGNVVVTFPGGMVRAAVGVWSARRLQSTTATDTATDPDNPISQALTMAAGSIGIAVGFTQGTTAHTWTGFTKNFQEDISDNNNSSVSGASLARATAGTVTVTMSTSFDEEATAMAVFR